ncbi:tetratricopeptide repeat protein, partial [Pseudomonas aeruginosa]
PPPQHREMRHDPRLSPRPLYTGWPGGVEKDTQKALDLYQKMIDLEVPQGFYDMGAMIGNRAGVKNPATDGLTFLDKAASLGNPPALTELGKLYIY